MDIIFTPGEMCDPFEYFCFGCGQMRLTFVNIDKCGNCQTPITHRGNIGELDKEHLVAEYNARCC